MHRTARALTTATVLVITGPTTAFASGWEAGAPAAAAACDTPAVPRAEIPEDVPGDIPDDDAGGGDCGAVSDAGDAPDADSGTGSGAGAGRSQAPGTDASRSQAPGTGETRSPAPGKAAPGTGQTPGRDSGDTGDRPDGGTGSGDRPDTGNGNGTGDRPDTGTGTGYDQGDPPPTVQHGVDAGTGGSFGGSVPLLAAGVALIAAACAAALHRICATYPPRGRRRSSDV
ncbi:hypothetical protein ACWEHT_07025 [Streptomyces sp. NPDC004646]